MHDDFCHRLYSVHNVLLPQFRTRGKRPCAVFLLSTFRVLLLVYSMRVYFSLAAREFIRKLEYAAAWQTHRLFTFTLEYESGESARVSKLYLFIRLDCRQLIEERKACFRRREIYKACTHANWPSVTVRQRQRMEQFSCCKRYILFPTWPWIIIRIDVTYLYGDFHFIWPVSA